MEEIEKVVRPILRILGFAFCIVGILTAAYEKSFSGFMLFMWFIMAICAFRGVLYTILLSMERRAVG